MSREATNKILELVEDGVLNAEYVLTACLKYMSEDDMRDMAHSNEIDLDDEDYYEDDGQPDEAQEWYDFDPEC